jgi:hypothetical protein
MADTAPSQSEKIALARETAERRKALLKVLVEYCQAAGGHVVSLPGASTVRIEVPQGSDLPVKLADLGWKPIQCGSSTRVTRHGIEPVDRIEVTLEK